jgi:hypothetical protein
MRKRWSRIGLYLLLNVVVSALTTWIVVSLMLRANLIPISFPEPDGVVDQPVVEDSAPVTAAGSNEVIIPDQLEINSVIGADDLENERVLIQHIGSVELSLAGWQLVDEQGNTYTFPALTMFSGGAVTVYTRVGTDNVVELYWGLDIPIYQEGETITLLDPEGIPQAVYTVP